MKIGILGGTFNPIHLAHLRIAEVVRDRLALEQVLFIPAATPPHKPMTGELPFAARLAMVGLAIADNPAFALSAMEGERSGASYSIDTLRALRTAQPDDEFFFIIGSDSFLEFGLWHDYAALFACCNIVVLERPGAEIGDLGAAVPAAVAGEFSFFPAEHRLAHCSGYSVYYLKECLLDISSTRIRQMVRQGRSIRYLVPAAVERYIIEQELYVDAR
ncbi:MAG: nicotinate (nicotinamide) nucleotide adenylyltransferase [Geobacter sp.]|nr:nicotinate (nicotinamide) nucleotide adenylyltransferase [Geobacter sp.]